MPGDEYLEGERRARVVMTRAISINAQPERVWPWLSQLGRGAGWYSVDWLDNGRKVSAWHIVSWIPEPRLGDATAIGYLRHIGTGHSLAWWLGGAKFVGICHDDPEVTPPEKIRYDACVTVDQTFQPEGDIGVQTIAAGEYATTTHFGPYERLSQTYAELLGQWLPRSGRELRSAPSLEFYMNDPEGTDPEDLITDIYAPLEPKD